MPQPRQSQTEAAEALVAVAPLVSRWIERLLAGHEPSLTVAQFLALRAIAAEGVSGSELARRAGVSGPAVSQLLVGLVDAGLLERRELSEDRRRQTLKLSKGGERALGSAQRLLRERLSSLLAELPRRPPPPRPPAGPLPRPRPRP